MNFKVKKCGEKLKGQVVKAEGDREYLCYHVIAIGQEGADKAGTREVTREGQG